MLRVLYHHKNIPLRVVLGGIFIGTYPNNMKVQNGLVTLSNPDNKSHRQKASLGLPQLV